MSCSGKFYKLGVISECPNTCRASLAGNWGFSDQSIYTGRCCRNRTLKQEAQAGNIHKLNIIVAIDIKTVRRGIVKVWGINPWAPRTQTGSLLLWLHEGVCKSRGIQGFCFGDLSSNSSWDLEVWMSHWSPLDPLSLIWLEFRVQPWRQRVSRAPEPLCFLWSESSFQFPVQIHPLSLCTQQLLC